MNANSNANSRNNIVCLFALHHFPLAKMEENIKWHASMWKQESILDYFLSRTSFNSYYFYGGPLSKSVIGFMSSFPINTVLFFSPSLKHLIQHF